MFNHVVTSGCSLTYGAELTNRDQRYIKYMADSIGAILIDYSMGGYGNETISTKLIDGLLYQLKNKLIDPRNTLVVVNWTYATRLVYYNREAKGWFSLFSHRVNKDRAKKRLVRVGEAHMVAKNLSSRINNAPSFVDKVVNLFVEKYVEYQYDQVPSSFDIVESVIDNNKNIKSVEKQIDEYLRYVVPNDVFDKHSHYTELENYFYHHSDPKFLLYELASIIHKTTTFLKLHGFSYAYSFVSDATRVLIVDGKANYEYMYNNCYDREGFGSFYNLLDDIDLQAFFNIPFEEFSENNKYAVGGGGHPLEEAHLAYGKQFLNFIQNRFANE